ncbi:MAG: DUF2959 family protein [Pseudomonadota bacterium]
MVRRDELLAADAAPRSIGPATAAVGPLRVLLLAFSLLLAGCETISYSFWEQFGYEKRDFLISNVEAAQEAQEEAKEEFADALEQFSSVVTVEPSELRDVYDRLSSAFEDAEDQAEEVSERIDDVENVSDDLFREWRSELSEYDNANLRSASERQLKTSEAKYADLIRAMRRAESRMEPVLNAFRDNVLFLKHNLNAQAIASLKTELSSIESNVSVLIREMEASIAESESFINDMKQA